VYHEQPIKQAFILSGSVGVYSACDKQAKPLYCSTAKTGKHTDPVWEVRLSVVISTFGIWKGGSSI
jgi:hypothetical protein